MAQRAPPASTPRTRRATSTGLDEAGLARRLAAVERARVALELGEHAAERVSSRSSKPVPTRPAYVSTPSCARRPRGRRTARRGALAGQPAADHDVGLQDVLDLHPAVRARPGGTGQSRRLAMTPSSPWAREASSIAAPSPAWCAGVCQRRPGGRARAAARGARGTAGPSASGRRATAGRRSCRRPGRSATAGAQHARRRGACGSGAAGSSGRPPRRRPRPRRRRWPRGRQRAAEPRSSG